jgi:hypothetical protein
VDSGAVTVTSGAADCGDRALVQVAWGDPRLPDRFWNKVSPCPMTGCWHWTDVRPIFEFHEAGKRGRTSAKQLAYEALHGHRGDCKKMVSTCRVTGCVNPDHLREPRDTAHWRRNSREWRKKNFARQARWQRDYGLKRRYGISLQDEERMLREQDHRCAICLERFGPNKCGRTGASVDHAHDETRRVRALLCRGCNSGIGLLKDRPDLLRAAADYIERHAAKAAK